MPLDPKAAKLIRMLKDLGGPALNEMTPAEARIAARAFAGLDGNPEPVADLCDRTIPGPEGAIPLRIYTPVGGHDRALPCLVYYHGGGWVVGDLDGVDTACRALANRAECRVVSVDYRLAPEHKFPAPLDDCYAALEWVAANGPSIGIDPARLAVGGDSAGGNLGAAVCIKARDERGPTLQMQLLIYPVTNHDFNSASYRDNGEGYVLTLDKMRWFWEHYLNNVGDGRNPLASPLLAPDLSRLQRAFVLTAEFDPLRDEGEEFAVRLREAGVPVRMTRYDGQIHGFFLRSGLFPAAATAIDDAAFELKSAFAARPLG